MCVPSQAGRAPKNFEAKDRIAAGPYALLACLSEASISRCRMAFRRPWPSLPCDLTSSSMGAAFDAHRIAKGLPLAAGAMGVAHATRKRALVHKSGQARLGQPH